MSTTARKSVFLSVVLSAAAMAGALFLGCGGGSSPVASGGPVAPVDEAPPTANADLGAAKSIELFNAWAAAIEAGDFDKVASLYAEDATFQTGNNPQKMVGAKQIAETMKGYGTAFPDMEHYAVTVIARDRWLCAVALSRGTNSGEMMGQKATNKRTSFLGMQIWQINDAGKIQTAVAYADNLNFLGHIGMWQGEVRAVDESEPARVDVQGAGSDANAAIATKSTEAIAAHDVDAIASLYSDGAVLDDTSAVGPATGTEDIRSYWTTLFARFPDLEYKGVEAQAVGDRVVITYGFVATNKGDLPRFGAKATGKALELVSADLLEISGGKIARHDIFMDGMSVGIVLGLIKL